MLTIYGVFSRELIFQSSQFLMPQISLSISFPFSIFVAFILEAFMLEYSFTHGKIETVISKKIEEKGIGVGM